MTTQSNRPGTLSKSKRILIRVWPVSGLRLRSNQKEGGSLIGHIALKMQDQQQAEIGFTFSGAYQGKGLAFEATTHVLDYAFTKLSLHRVIAITDCENERSVALLRRLGMRQEGHHIQNIWFKGKWGDEYSFAILREEWLRKRAG